MTLDYLLLLVSKSYINGPNQDSNESRDLCFESREWDFPGINVPNADYAVAYYTCNTTIQWKEIHDVGQRKQIIYEDITKAQWRHLAYHL